MLYSVECETCEYYCDCEPWNDPEDYDEEEIPEPRCLKQRIAEAKLMPGYE